MTEQDKIPECPKCRTSPKKTQNYGRIEKYGQDLWGCDNSPECLAMFLVNPKTNEVMQSEMDKWAESIPQFNELTNGVELLGEMDLRVCQVQGVEDSFRPLYVTQTDYDIEVKYMEHIGVDRIKLEHERRTLLEYQRSLNER